MAKRFVTALLVIIASIIFVVAAFFLVLFLAPGFSVFGLKYIASDARAVAGKGSLTEFIVNKDNNDEYRTTDQILNNLKGIKVETTEIPVKIILSSGWDYEFDYYDNYNGFTTTNIEYPTLQIDFKDNIMIIKSVEFERFLGEMTTSKRYLNLYLPISQIGSSLSQKINFDFTSTRSDISFILDSGMEESIPQFNTMSITTNGGLSTDSKIVTSTFKYITTRKINIENNNKSIIAQNYELESKNSSIIVNCDVDGDLKATTNYGDIKVQNITGSFYATTNHGTIASNTENPIEVGGLAFITTKSGSVNIGKIKGINGNSKISSHSGNINIERLENAEIETTRGTVDVKTVNTAKVVTNLGKVKIEEVKASIDINTKRGNVYLGGKSMTVKDATVFSRLGKLYIYSTTGKTKLETISGNIYYENDSSSEIQINCGGKLTAKNLTGTVKINANEDVSLQFKEINQDCTIELGDSCYNATIECTSNTTSSIRYSLTGSYVELYEQNETGGYTRISEGETQNNQSNSSASLLKVTGKFAHIKIYFKSSLV